MKSKTFAAIVAKPSATFPIAGTLFNYNYLIGHDGFIGIKTGSHSAAGGCWAFAAQRSVNGKPTVVYGVVLGQRDQKTGQLIQPALDLGRKLALHAPWRDDVRLVTKEDVTTVAAPGQQYAVDLELQAPDGSSVDAGETVGTLTIAGVSTPVVVERSAPGPTVKWRLTRF
jgi:D-alanyl-D-alanine carboxypeptidase (penicillin-binding protein 5/6)